MKLQNITGKQIYKIGGWYIKDIFKIGKLDIKEVYGYFSNNYENFTKLLNVVAYRRYRRYLSTERTSFLLTIFNRNYLIYWN